MPKVATITLVKDSDKKHSVLFKSDSPGSVSEPNVLDSLYLKRPFSDGVKKIKVTIETVE